MLSADEVSRRFRYPFTGPDSPAAAAHIRIVSEFTELAVFLNETLPEGRAKSVTLTELEDASLWAHQALSEKPTEIDWSQYRKNPNVT